MLLNVAVGGNFPGSPDGSTIFPQEMIVDYVRVYADSAAGTTGAYFPAHAPDRFELLQNYPNPFNPTTEISYHLAEERHVRLTINDMLGRELAELVHDSKPAGRHTETWDATRMASGMYVYRLEAIMSGEQSFTQTKRMLLLR
jgi:hypothetical protein